MHGVPCVLPSNAGFFLAEIVAGVAAGSAALRADALDFFGDASNSIGVAGMVLTWRARAALAKGGSLIVFALWVAKVETSIGRYERVIGDALRSRTDQTEATEVAIAAVALNQMLAFASVRTPELFSYCLNNR